jgi:hypothetical protein
MKKFLKKLPKKNVFWIVLVVLLALPTFWRLLGSGYFPMHDDMQAMRVLQLHKCVLDGQFPCRWVPDMGYGYGYPQFNFYSPLPYYVMEGFHLLGLSVLGSVKIGFLLSFLLSALAMFLLGRSLWGNWGGLVSSVFYTYAPYRAIDAYNRGAVGEIWALVFLPLIFWSIYKFIKREKSIYLLWLALSLGGLLLSHNISSMILLPFIIGWTLLLLFIFKKWVLIKRLIFGGIWGIGLAAFFILPAIFEKKFVHTETMLMGYFNYLAHFVSWRQLFFSTHWGYGSSILGPHDNLSLSVGIFHWFFSLSALILVFREKKKKMAIFLIALFLFAGGLLALYMSHLRSIWIWNLFPFLSWVQFPWRFLLVAIFLFSLLSGGVLKFIRHKKNNLFVAGLLIFLVIFLNVGFFRPSGWYDITDQDKFSGELWEKQLTISIFDYLPIYASLPPSSRAPAQPYFIRGEGGEIKNFQKGTNWQKFEVEVIGESLLQLPLYDFPGWQVLANGKPMEINHENELGLITVKLEEGDYQIDARLKDTPVRKSGNIISIISLMALPAFWFIRVRRKNAKI